MFEAIALCVFALIYIILSALTNRFRGGYPSLGLPGHPRMHDAMLHALIGVGFFFAFGLSLPFLYAVLATAALMWIGNMFGWGNYFDIGHTVFEHRSSVELYTIDHILNFLFGPMWIPSWEKNPELYTRFDVVPSPTGTVRPRAWGEKRDLVGMTLRGLLLSPMYLAPILIIGFPVLPLAIGVGVPFALLFGALLGPVYWFGWKWFMNSDHFGQWKIFSDELEPTSFAEYLYGAIRGLGILLAFTIGFILL